MQDNVAPSLVANPEQPATRSSYHLITSEYPPQTGGVSDYSRQLAAGLAECGDEVHVWCPASPDGLPFQTGVQVHRQFGAFSHADLERVGAELDTFPGPRRLLVQWVPHGYGYRSMNLGFCWWLWKRVRRHGDRIQLMVHEPFLTFSWTSPVQNALALVHRFMTVLLLNASDRVWMSIPGWEKLLRPYALGRKVPFRWLPIPSNIPVSDDRAQVEAVRLRYATGKGVLIGHFGTYGASIVKLLEPILAVWAKDPPNEAILLIGKGSDRFRRRLIEEHPQLSSLIHATGILKADEISHHLAACDLLIQPYPDGVSSRRTSFMAGLAHGKPIVSTTGWLSEALWTQCGAVALAPAGDPNAFHRHVQRLCGDAGERQRLGSASGRLYREQFDSSHIISSLRNPETGKDRECAY